MKQSQLRLASLLAGYFENRLSPIELDEFSAYVEDPVYAGELQDLLGAAFERQNEPLNMPGVRRNRVLKNVLGQTGNGRIPQPLTRRIWQRTVIAAAAVFICVTVAALFYYNVVVNKARKADLAYNNDIQPGSQGASLTLSNGKKISLADAMNGQLAEEDGVKISKSANGQLVYEIKGSRDQKVAVNVLSTARGQTYQLRLPDGTLVSLNAASSLTYSSQLMDKGKRKVKLTGEGFFEVAKDKTHPFVVECKGQEVEVLGTHFNVKGYSGDQKVLTTLLEGAVNVHYEDRQYLLKPGQQALNDGEKVLVQSANIAEVIAWKEGYFRFNDAPLPAIMDELALWYDIAVNYEGKFTSEGISGRISRNKPISDVLKMLENTGLVKFKIEGRRVTVLE